MRAFTGKETKTEIYFSREFSCVKYHNTEVYIRKYYVEVTLNSNKFKTNTTKKRINQAFKEDRIDAKLIQKQGKWYVISDGDSIEFYDGIQFLIRNDGTLEEVINNVES